MRPTFAAPRGEWVVNGAIAQLGERLPCTQEVGGSIPPSSTKLVMTNLSHLVK